MLSLHALKTEEIDDEDGLEEVDDDGPEVEELDEVLADGASSAGLGLHIDGIEDDEDGGVGGGRGGIACFSGDAVAAAAAAAAAAPPDDGAPRALKRWLLPPSLTPKRGRRSGVPPETVPVEADARPSADGAWRCGKCGAAYEARIGLFAHARFCAKRAAAWACEWCACSEVETSHKASGPNGPKTLCSTCGQRYRHGADSMPLQTDTGEFLCATCHRGFPSMKHLGGHRRFCDGGVWRCQWCECKWEDSGGKGPGPAGAMTLCSACSQRYKSGHAGPPPKNEAGLYVCDKCERTFESIMGLGSHRKRCDGGQWRCQWCECKADEASGKGPGPSGGGTLCSLCSSRFRSGHVGLPSTNADGRYPCERCERTFESFRALGMHSRDCDGGQWRCEWCECKADETSGKAPGPHGGGTLCSACGARHRAGHSGPPPKNDQGLYVCDKCERTFESIMGLGSHRKRCDGGQWRCEWCQCKADEASGKGRGPSGGGTLCSLCSSRFRAGHHALPPTDANGRYPCERCGRTFESFRALGMHSRDCDGGQWRCEWCECKADETSGKGPGPNGSGTLCSACGSRYRNGATGPVLQDAFGQFPCEVCGRPFETISGLGTHRRHCTGVRKLKA